MYLSFINQNLHKLENFQTTIDYMQLTYSNTSFPSTAYIILSRKVYVAQNYPFLFILKFPVTATSRSILFVLLLCFIVPYTGWEGTHSRKIFADSERTTASNL